MVLGLSLVLGLAAIILPISRRLNIPYTVLLAVVGFILGLIEIVVDPVGVGGILGDFLHSIKNFKITSDAVMFIFLPALIFNSGLSIDAHRLLDDLGPILLLAVVGLLISTVFIGYTVWMVSGMSMIVCLLLGAIVSATDPVAVVSIFKDLHVPKRLAILVEGESLFNDATAIVLYSIFSLMVMGNSDSTLTEGVVLFLKVFLGGIVVGYLIATIMGALFKRIKKVPIVKITLTISLAYVSFIIAEHYLHVSGVMATVTAALVTGTMGRSTLKPSTWNELVETWEHVGFWANSLIFILVGVITPQIILNIGKAELKILVILTIAAFFSRALIIYGLLPVLSIKNMLTRVDTAFKTVMFWGGLRGAVSLALALAVMENPSISHEVRQFIGILVTGFVLFTLLVNATTIGLVVRFFRLDKLSITDQIIRDRATALSLIEVSGKIETVTTEMQVDPKISEALIDNYKERVHEMKTSVEQITEITEEEWLVIGLLDISIQERENYLKLFDDRLVDSNIIRQLLSKNDNLLDGIRSNGVKGYTNTWQENLKFDWRYGLAMRLHRRFGYTGYLSRLLSDRFELFMADSTTMNRLIKFSISEVAKLLGPEIEKKLRVLLDERYTKSEKAQNMLKLQYPVHGAALEKNYLGRMALRLEESIFENMLDNSIIDREVFADLGKELDSTSKKLDKIPQLDLGLTPVKLVSSVSFLSNLDPVHLQKIVGLLKTRLALPDELIIKKGMQGQAMYFISSGAVEVELDPDPVLLGTNDFFGEIALLLSIPRIANVRALGFCELLVLYVKDFQTLLDSEPDLRKTIEKVAVDRLKMDGMV